MKSFYNIPKYRIVWFLMLLAFNQIFSQDIPFFLKEDNNFIRSKVDKVELAGWLFFNQSSEILPGELLIIDKQYLGLSSFDSMMVTKEWSDKYEWSHIRYQQLFKGIKVEGGEWTEHFKDCYLEIAHGKLIEGLDLNTSPRVTKTQAVEIAARSIGSNKYAWQDLEWERALKEELNDPNATYYPNPELLIGHVGGPEFVKSNYKLSWKFQIRSIDPILLKEVYVDAITGEILRCKDAEDNNGPATLLFGYGNHTIDTKARLWYYILHANDDGHDIVTKYGPTILGFNLTPNITDGDDEWGTNEQLATTVHWGITQAWDYYKIIHGRNGYNNNGQNIRIWANSSLQNAGRWVDANGQEYIEIGTINGQYLGALDIMKHEFTHGITANVSGLGGEFEPGALNESFSDIFGVMVERYVEGAINDWTLGEDAPVIINGGTIVRSLENPGAFPAPAMPDRAALGLPDTWHGPRWYFGNNDDGGEHINCGVQNRWFNLISVGGDQNGIHIDAIGVGASEDITYYNLSTFIQNGSQYADSRIGAITAARIIFGNCSFQEIQTTNAWAACGVGNVFQGPCLVLSGPRSICVPLVKPIRYTAYGEPGVSFNWYWPDQWVAHTEGIGNKYLIVTGIGQYEQLPTTVMLRLIASNGASITINVLIRSCITKPPCFDKILIQRNDNLYQSEFYSRIQTESELNKSKPAFEIYPNPSENYIELFSDQIFGPDDYFIVRNSSGIIIKKIKVKDFNGIIDISDYPSGIYFLTYNNSNDVQTYKFIKI